MLPQEQAQGRKVANNGNLPESTFSTKVSVELVFKSARVRSEV